jgi:hypothetical protein
MHTDQLPGIVATVVPRSVWENQPLANSMSFNSGLPDKEGKLFFSQESGQLDFTGNLEPSAQTFAEFIVNYRVDSHPMVLVQGFNVKIGDTSATFTVDSMVIEGAATPAAISLLEAVSLKLRALLPNATDQEVQSV